VLLHLLCSSLLLHSLGPPSRHNSHTASNLWANA